MKRVICLLIGVLLAVVSCKKERYFGTDTLYFRRKGGTQIIETKAFYNFSLGYNGVYYYASGDDYKSPVTISLDWITVSFRSGASVEITVLPNDTGVERRCGIYGGYRDHPCGMLVIQDK